MPDQAKRRKRGHVRRYPVAVPVKRWIPIDVWLQRVGLAEDSERDRMLAWDRESA